MTQDADLDTTMPLVADVLVSVVGLPPRKATSMELTNLSREQMRNTEAAGAMPVLSASFLDLSLICSHATVLFESVQLQSFAVVGECCGLRNRPQSAPIRSAMASAEEPAGLRTAKFRRYTLSFDSVL
jgi:hypothetical protein